jgi:hypothetical protein
VAYWWPEASRAEPVARQDPEDPTKRIVERTTSRKTEWGFDPDVAVALAVAFFLYVGVQAWLAIQAAPDLTEPAAPPRWAKFVIGLAPVVVGALTSPDQS